MAENLLQNSGCEEGAHQKSRYWTPDGGPYFDEFDNIWPPIGWTAWWIDRLVNDGSPPDQKTGRPEFHTLTVPPFPDPVRLRSGEKFAKLHTFFRTHYAGWLQQVPVTASCAYQFSIYAHSWYSGCSTKPHTFPLLVDCRTPASDSHDILQVGIGPGGDEQSPLSDKIIWGEPVEIYGGYAQPLVVEAAAQSDVITVWLRSWTNYALQHGDVYFDDAKLVEVEPPYHYERTYVLLPNNQPFDPEEQQRITKLNPGMTIGPSADDSAIGHKFLTKTTVISYKPQTWGGIDALEAFWREYYDFPRPQDVIEYREVPDPPPSGLLQWQCDLRWGNYVFGDNNCHQTLCDAGCFITNCSMAQKFYDIDPDATPTSIDAALGPAGYAGCVANWAGNPGLYATALQLEIEKTLDNAVADAHLAKGNVAMAEVSPVSREHFVLVLKKIGGRYWCADPYKNVEGWLDTFYSSIDSWRLVTKVDPGHPDNEGRIGPHLQQEVGDWRGLSAVTIPMKFLAGIQNIVTVKQIGPESFPVWRQHVNHQGLYLENADHDAGANAYLDTFRDSMEEVLEEIARTMPGLERPWFGVESLNETYAHGDPKVVTQSIPFDRAWLRVLARYPEVSPVVYCAAVGNIELPLDVPGSQAWKDLVTLAKEGEAQHAAWGYHCFSADTEILTSRGWMLFPDLVAQGRRLDWAAPIISVATLDSTTGKVEYQEATHYWEHDYEGEMIHLFGKVDVMVTPNHRMWIRTHPKNAKLHDPTDHVNEFEFCLASDLPNTFETKRDLGLYEGIEQKEFEIPEYHNEWTSRGGQHSFTKPARIVPMDGWLKFLGYYITEGSTTVGAVVIHQNPGEICEKIGEAFQSIGYDATHYSSSRKSSDWWYVGDVQLAKYLRRFGKSHDKHIPGEILNLSARQLRILFDAMMEGDGCCSGTPTYCTASRQLADDFQEIALKIGYGATVSQHCDGYYYVSIACKRLTPMTTKNYVERVEYSGSVYCVTVPNSLIFVRRNGKPSWQGNSYWIANPQESLLVSHWDYLAGRWTLFDEYLVDHGAHVNWFFGETGAIGGHFDTHGYHFLPHDGWKSSYCYAGNWARYEQDLLLLNTMIQEWNTTHGNRAFGGTIFTTGGGEKWKTFEIGPTEIKRLKVLLS